jgi:hypothetical protein
MNWFTLKKILTMSEIPTTTASAYVSLPVVSPQPGLFGTKIPASVAFAIAVLLFFMPFIDIKCNTLSLQTVTGVQLATGFKMKNNSSNNSFFNDLKTPAVDEVITESTAQASKSDPNLYALVALGLGVLGFALSFMPAKTATAGGLVTGALAVAALIGLWVDLKNKINTALESNSRGNDGLGLNNWSQQIGEGMRISIDFTPWFYVAAIAFLAAAVFSFMRTKKG